MSSQTIVRGQRSRTQSPSMNNPSATRGPTEEQIRMRAFEIFMARGATPGNPEDDWRQAEEELRGRMRLLGRS